MYFIDYPIVETDKNAFISDSVNFLIIFVFNINLPVLYIGSLILFVLALIGMSAAFFAIFYWIVDWNYPTMQGASSILQV